jgi:CBS domain-containing protein
MWLNLGLAAFNLLPAFPMDGGRVLRAVLATQQDYARATRLAANVGRAMAALFAVLGLVTVNIVLLLIAFFVYVGAQQEAQQAVTRQVTRAASVREAMMTRFARLAPDDTLGDAVHKLLAGPEHDLPVVDADGAVTGVLRRRTLVRALSERGRQTRVAEVMEAPRLTVAPSMDLDEAFGKMRTAKGTIAPVVDPDEGLVGLLTVEQVGELVMVASAMDTTPDRDAA